MPLSRQAVVVRGGLSTIETLRDNAEDMHDDDGVWGVSAWVATDGDVDRLLAELSDLLPHRKIRTVTVGTLRDAGFGVEETPPPKNHVTIQFEGPPAHDLLARLESLFGPAAVKPQPRRSR